MAETMTRNAKPWTADFQRVQDMLSSALGCEVRWFSEYGEIHARQSDGSMLLLEGHLPERRDAYFWMRGRLTAEAEK